MNDFTPLRFGVRQDWTSQRWHLEVAIPARKDQWTDVEDVVQMIDPSTTYPSEASAMSGLADVLAALIHG